MLQISHNLDLVCIDGLSGLQSVGNMYISNNPRLCYILGALSNQEYWMVSNTYWNKNT